MAIRVWQGSARDVVCENATLQAGDIKFKGERFGVLSEGNAQTVFFGDKSGEIAVCQFRSGREESDQVYIYIFTSPVFAKLFFGKELELLTR